MRRRRAADRDFSKSVQQQKSVQQEVGTFFKGGGTVFEENRIAASAQFLGRFLGTKIKERDCWLVA